MCAGPESGVSSTVAGAEQREHLRQRVAADLIRWALGGQRQNAIAHLALDALGPPHRTTRMLQRRAA